MQTWTFIFLSFIGEGYYVFAECQALNVFYIMEFLADVRLSWAAEFQHAFAGRVGIVNGLVDVLNLMHWENSYLLVVADLGLLAIVVAGSHLFFFGCHSHCLF
jgi:hypothetical protein